MNEEEIEYFIRSRNHSIEATSYVWESSKNIIIKMINQLFPSDSQKIINLKTTVEEFEDMGVNIVIAANHMLRAAYPAMLKVAKSILENGRSLEAEPDCMPIKEILEFIPGTK